MQIKLFGAFVQRVDDQGDQHVQSSLEAVCLFCLSVLQFGSVTTGQ
jgi:hypothetical protein